MSNSLSELRQLAYLAHEQTAESRRELLGRITDAFMESPAVYTKLQSTIFGDILEKLAYDLETQARQELARRIAAEEHAPRKLVRRLASDEIAVAEPVLQQSPVLTQDDLVEISEQGGQQHLLAITQRMDVGERLAAVLVNRGHDVVVESLVRNESAKISPDDVESIARRAMDSQPLQSALIDRDEVPKEIMIGLLEHVSDKLKTAIQDKLTAADKDKLDDVIGAMKAVVEESEDTRAERHIDELARRGVLDEQAVLRFVFEERPLEFLLAFAKIAEIDASSAQHILGEATGQGIVVAFRASGFSVEAFKSIALSPMTAVHSDLHKVMSLVNIYRRLSLDNAQRAMRFWRMRKHGVEVSKATSA